MKRDFEKEDEFQEIPVIWCEVMPPKFCQELLLKVRLFSFVMSPLIPFHLVCHHKALRLPLRFLTRCLSTWYQVFFFQGLWVSSDWLLIDLRFKALLVLADRVERRKHFFFFPVFQLFLLSPLPLNMPTLWPELLCSDLLFPFVGSKICLTSVMPLLLVFWSAVSLYQHPKERREIS